MPWAWSPVGLAGQFMRGSYGLVGDVVLGIVGAIVATYVGGLILGRDLMVAGFTLQSVVVAFVGAAVTPRRGAPVYRRRRFGAFGRGGS